MIEADLDADLCFCLSAAIDWLALRLTRASLLFELDLLEDGDLGREYAGDGDSTGDLGEWVNSVS